MEVRICLEKPSNKGLPSNTMLHAPYAETVFVAGSFNGWNSEANPMKRDKEGTWSAVMDLFPGTYEYRFIVDDRWNDDPTCEIRNLNQ